MVIHTVALREPADNPPRLVAVQGAVGVELVAEDPLAGDDMSSGRPRDQGPGGVSAERGDFLLHGATPVLIVESSTHR